MDLKTRINIELAKPANYIPMGFWVKPVMGDTTKPFYHITDLGVPMVKVADGTALGYSVYVLQVDMSNDVVPSISNPQWRLVESAELIYIQQAFIERLWVQMLVAEGAEIGGFEIKNGLLQSKAKDANNNPLIVLNGNTGQAEITGVFISNSTGNKIKIDPTERRVILVDASNRIVGELKFDIASSDDYAASMELNHFYQGIRTSSIKIGGILSNMIIRTYNSSGSITGMATYNINGYTKNI